MLLSGFGEEGQRRLLGSHAVIVGCGALGCVSADLLARAGVGRLTIIDRDVVEATNLQRQTLYDEEDARTGTPKAAAAVTRLRRVNSEIDLRPVVADFNPDNAEELILDGPSRPNVILDGTDNFQTRYLINDVSVREEIPYVYAGAVGSRGMMMNVVPGGPCLRCMFPEMPAAGSAETCDTAGVLGPVISIVAGAQAAEALKILLGRMELVSRTLLEFDLWENRRRRIELPKQGSPDCLCCAKRDYEFLEGRGFGGTVRLCGRNSVQVIGRQGQVDLEAVAERLAAFGSVQSNELLVRARVPGGESSYELTLFADGRAIIAGTDDPGIARSVYARYVGS